MSAPLTPGWKDTLERAAYTAVATGAAILIADGAARGVTHISVADYKAAGVAALAGALTALKQFVVNYLNTHQSLKSQVEALSKQLNAQSGNVPPAAPPAA